MSGLESSNSKKRDRDTRKSEISSAESSPEAETKRDRKMAGGDSDSDTQGDPESMEAIFDKLIRSSETRSKIVLKSELNKLESSLKHAIKVDLDQIKQKQTQFEADLAVKNRAIAKLEHSMRKNNVVIHNFKESANETSADRECAIHELGEKLKVTIDYADAYRLGRRTEGKDRPLLLKMIRFKDKIALFQAARSYEEEKYYITDDLTQEGRLIRSNLATEKKKILESDPSKQCKIRGKKLIVQGENSTKVYGFNLETKQIVAIPHNQLPPSSST